VTSQESKGSGESRGRPRGQKFSALLVNGREKYHKIETSKGLSQRLEIVRTIKIREYPKGKKGGLIVENA